MLKKSSWNRWARHWADRCPAKNRRIERKCFSATEHVGINPFHGPGNEHCLGPLNVQSQARNACPQGRNPGYVFQNG